jgi:CTP:molybdopterin cytidylyltransferase MocA
MGSDVGAFPLVVLAGGRSARLGSPKGLVAIDGRPWLELQIERFVAAGGTHVVVVTGFDTAAYAHALAWFDDARAGTRALGAHVTSCENPNPEAGPFASLVCGLALCVDAPGAWVLPIDVPLASAKTLEALVHALVVTAGASAALPTLDGRGGHPVLLAASFAERVRSIPRDTEYARLDWQLRALDASALIRVTVHDAEVCLNLNRSADWDRLRAERARTF